MKTKSYLFAILWLLLNIFYIQECFSKTNLTVGSSAFYTNYNNSQNKYLQDDNILHKPQNYFRNLNIGVSTTPFDDKRFVFGIATNRLVNSAVNRKIQDKSTGLTFKSSSKVAADTILGGYRYHKFLPQLFLSSVRVDNKVYYHDTLVGNKKIGTLLYGLNLSYFSTRNLAFATTLIAPNASLNIEYGLGFGVNFFF